MVCKFRRSTYGQTRYSYQTGTGAGTVYQITEYGRESIVPKIAETKKELKALVEKTQKKVTLKSLKELQEKLNQNAENVQQEYFNSSSCTTAEDFIQFLLTINAPIKHKSLSKDLQVVVQQAFCHDRYTLPVHTAHNIAKSKGYRIEAKERVKSTDEIRYFPISPSILMEKRTSGFNLLALPGTSMDEINQFTDRFQY